MQPLPGAFNPEGTQLVGHAFVQVSLYQAIHAASAGAAAQAGPQCGQVGFTAGGHHFHVAFLGVAHPAAQVQFAGLAVYVPAEAHALHSSLNQKMKNHR